MSDFRTSLPRQIVNSLCLPKTVPIDPKFLLVRIFSDRQTVQTSLTSLLIAVPSSCNREQPDRSLMKRLKKVSDSSTPPESKQLLLVGCSDCFPTLLQDWGQNARPKNRPIQRGPKQVREAVDARILQKMILHSILSNLILKINIQFHIDIYKNLPNSCLPTLDNSDFQRLNESEIRAK